MTRFKLTRHATVALLAGAGLMTASLSAQAEGQLRIAQQLSLIHI